MNLCVQFIRSFLTLSNSCLEFKFKKAGKYYFYQVKSRLKTYYSELILRSSQKPHDSICTDRVQRTFVNSTEFYEVRATNDAVWWLLQVKGQLISEGLFDVFNFPKNNQKSWWIFALKSRNWSNWKCNSPFIRLCTK